MPNNEQKSGVNFLNNESGNKNQDSALLKEEELIRDSAFNTTAFDPEFKERLKTQILEKRHKKFTMKEKIFGFFSRVRKVFTPDFTMKRFVPVVATATLVAVLALTLNFNAIFSNLLHPGEKDLPFARFFVDIAYAHENFEVVATDDTVVGVQDSTGFKITSKTPISDVNQLKQSIKFIPDTDFTLEKISDTEFLAKPAVALEGGELYKLLIGSAYIDENGLQVDYDYSWAFQVKNVFKIISTLPAHQGSGVPINSGIEVAFSTDKFIGFEDAFTMVPAVKGKFERHGRVAVFVPDQLDYETVYTVTVRPTVGVEGSNETLNRETVFQFVTEKKPGENVQNNDQGFQIYDSVLEFNTATTPLLTGYSYNNEKEVAVKVYAFNGPNGYMDELKKYDGIPYWAYDARAKIKTDFSSLSVFADYKLPLASENYNHYLSLPSPLPAGYYAIVVNEGKKYSDYVLVQVTDVAAFYQVNNDKTLFWVNDIATKSPLSGALVVDTHTSAAVKTDQNGVAIFETPKYEKTDTDSHRFLISSGDRSLVLPISFYSDNSLSYTDRYWVYFYTDRARYQPTDEINFWGVVKTRGQDLTPNQVTVSLLSNSFDYNQESVALTKQKITLDDHGNYVGKLSFKNVTPGYYRLLVKDGEQTVIDRYISVETYVKPSYKLEVQPARSQIYAGEKDEYTIKTSFFDGTPVSNIELGYNYYNKNGTVTTDEFGMAYLSFDTTYDSAGYNYFDRESHGLEVYVAKTETGDIRANTAVTVYGPNMGFRGTEIKGKDGQAEMTSRIFNRDLNNVDDDFFGNPAGNVSVTAKITEITYTAKETGTQYDFINKVSYKTYDYSEQRTNLPDIAMTSGADGRVTAKFNTDAKKTYLISFKASDPNGRSFTTGDFYYYASESVVSDNSWLYNYYNLKEKDPTAHTYGYKIGETAEFDFARNDKKIDQSNGGKFLYILSQKGLLNYEVNDNSHYTVNFDEPDVPNVYLSGVWFDGKTFHYADQFNIRLDKRERELKIQVESDQDKYVPGEEVKLNIQVTDKDGKPVSADVNLDLMDEAFAALGRTPADPLSEFYVSVSSGVVMWNNSHTTPTIGGGAERGGCFLAGTKIRMSDGSEKNIEDIKIGDKILTFVNEKTKAKAEGKVVKTYKHLVNDYLIINDRLYVTPEHRIFVNGVWQMIGEAKVGDVLTDESGMPVEIKKIEQRHELVSVYNFEVNPEHTYFASGIYVHNDKGDGARQYFPDIALFKTIRTDSRGEAEIKFKLPDNITSWIIIAQGFTQDIKVGVSETKIPVSLPAFVEVTMNNDFIVGDEPLVKLRAYGEALKTGDAVKYHLESKDLDLKRQDIDGKAFEATYFNLPNLKVGEYPVKSSIETGKYKDAVIKNIKVTNTRLEEAVNKNYILNDNPQIEGGKSGFTTLVFTDKNRGQYYNDTQNLMWTYGNRVDQKMSGVLGYDLLKKYFVEPEQKNGEFVATNYQDATGGIKLLPYSSPELELSAKVSAVGADYFDKASLSGYFYGVISSLDNGKKEGVNKDEVCEALYGLANLDEPVLLLVRDFAQVSDLSVKDRLYLGLAAVSLGDKKLANEIYTKIMKENSEEYAPYKRLNVSDKKDEIIEATALGAVLGAELADKDAAALWNYADQNLPKDLLINLEKIAYLNGVIPQLPSGPSKFYYEKDGEKTEKTLERGESFSLSVFSTDLPQMSFGVTQGNVAVMSRFYHEAKDIKNTTEFVALEKKYFDESGNETNTFKEGDLVKIQINYKLAEKAYDGDYEITDVLPSGLKYIEGSLKTVENDWCRKWSPNEIFGQKLRFYIPKDYAPCEQKKNDVTFYYYARVANLGKFKVEPALMQAVESSGIKAFSTFGEIMLEKK